MKFLKRIFHILMMSGLLGIVFVGSSYAQTGAKFSRDDIYSEATPQSSSPNPITSTQTVSTTTFIPDEISFERLGFDETVLRGPYDAIGMNMNLPASRKLTGGILELDFEAFFGGIGIKPAQDVGQLLGGTLEVSFNGKVLDTVQLDHEGDYHIAIPLSPEAVASPGKNGRNNLRLFLDSALSCRFDTQTNVTVRSASSFKLSYENTPLPTDLRLFPYPIFQQSFLPDVATVVVPDQPTAKELQAALTIVAGLGHLTSGKIELSVVPISQLTNEVRGTTHLILVGKPGHLPLLSAIPLPVSPGKTGFELKEARPDDGIIQVAISPWNSERLVLIVSGNSDVGVIKAGQATSSGLIRIGNRPDLAVVADVQPVPDEVVTTVREDQTFADLGYSSNQLSERGTNWAEYIFNIPAGKTVTPEAYFDLIFNHSSLLDYGQSGMVISLNDETIGSVQLSDESTKQKSEKILIPRHVIRSGLNKLLFRVELVPSLNCAKPNLDTLWLKIWPESGLHLPLVDSPVQITDKFDLNYYPEPFVPDPTLGNMAVVVSSTDPASWQTAAQIVFELGRRINNSQIELEVLYGDNIPENVRRERHLLIVGKASLLPITAELHDFLPAPFEPANDLAIERNVNIVYRFPQGTDMGYIELLPAPWDENRVIVAVLGSTDVGLGWAARALVVQDLQNQLSGNFAVINDQQIVVGNIRSKPVSPEIASTTITDTTDVSQSTSITNTLVVTSNISSSEEALAQSVNLPAPSRPGWLLPMLATSTGFMVVVIILAVFTAWRR